MLETYARDYIGVKSPYNVTDDAQNVCHLAYRPTR